MRKLAGLFVLLIAVVGVVAVVLLGGGASAEDIPPIQLGPDVQLPSKPKYPRLDSQLNGMVERLSRGPATAAAGGVPIYQDTKVAVTIRLSGSAPALAQFLGQRGATVANVGADYVEAYVPVELLPDLEGQPSVLRVQAIVPPQPAVVTSQGAAAHGAPAWNTGGFTGTGVKVGIIDVGFIGYSGFQGTELPSSVVARCYTVVGTFSSTLANCETGDVHGTAVAEAVVDIAPNVTLYIANPKSKGDLQATASWMVSQGIQIINHSVGWSWDGPGDGTSPFSDSPLKAVDTAVTGGVLWVNAAGNSALANWYGGYIDSDADRWMRFALSGSTEIEGNGVHLSAGETLTAQARWKDSWGNAVTDLDLYLFNSTLTSIVAFSDSGQSGGTGQYPMELINFTAPASGTYYLAIKRYAGPIPQWVQLDSFRDQALEYAVASTSIGNPAESANTGMLAVGAARWTTTSTIEYFSSQGPTTDDRVKPNIVGADRGDSVSYGVGGFAGTSQASPHVAGLAALVLSRFPGFTPVQVADYLKANALPRGTMPNNTWGYGFAQLPALSPGGSVSDYLALIAAATTYSQLDSIRVGFKGDYNAGRLTYNEYLTCHNAYVTRWYQIRGSRHHQFTTQPSASNTAGMTFGTQPVVRVQDANGNTVTTSTA
ncbi:MAG: S8 family serine peptidase, partial [Chloroflexota bacterium]|nr:S8 family serine peptidase [Chloroflexota bacterium]